ncbi:hypothetical protein [Pontibacter burrus]|uniref:STAS/SEC14 domain-containing protein n=1 Tax=Pontibacter burrus TaxID=2704466 RepID=A0A6B3LUS5_9BACT|nr:hypothetical protein [Pontibacter burrus]NEM97270.1 hypothetical protein [Pontibacter burrus]
MLTHNLKKSNGDVFLYYERVPENAYIFAHWVGRQDLDTVRRGGYAYLDMMKEQACAKLLNSHKELIGPWDIATDWISTYWTPAAVTLGLRYMAQVLAPGVYGQMSFHQLHQHIGNLLEIKIFENEKEAIDWLTSLPEPNKSTVLHN